MSKKKAKAPTSYLPLFPYFGSGENAIVGEGELIVVNFAGIGGACRGLERALRRPVTHAINHNPTAINLHRVNSPHTTHHIQDVWAVDPLELAAGRRIGVAWFSPDCKHFSKAKGGKPVEQNIRDLAWVVTRYTALPEHIKPRLIFLENVEEFADWGPLGQDSKPDKARKGETFREFVTAIESDGYEVQWRMLRACDYGAPTTRKRLFLIARCDGAPIVWPQPTHGHPDSPAVQRGELLPWRSAAECIDWSIPVPSIFDRKKPLVENTLRRVARGLTKYVLKAEKPYIVTATPPADPLMAPYVINKQHDNPARSVLQPLSTITTNHNKNELAAAGLVPYFVPRFGEAADQQPRVRPVTEPLATLTPGGNNAQMAAALLVQSGHYSNLTGSGSHFRGQPVTQPISTITASGTNNMLTLAHLVHFYGLKTPTDTRAQSLGTPLATQTTENRHGLVTASLVKHFGGGYTGSGIDLRAPLDTVTAVDHHALMTANLIKYFGTSKANSLDLPLGTVTTRDRYGLACASMIRMFGMSIGAALRDPMSTVMPDGGGKNYLMTADLVPGLTAQQSDRARRVYALMAQHAPEALTAQDHALRLVLVDMDGVQYVIADVMMRMLVSRELARGQSFDDSYELEVGADGQAITKTAQVAGIGNSVCPILAERLAEANTALQEAAD